MAATYNCTDATNSSYGASDYGTCDATIGAPNTGSFMTSLTTGHTSIILPTILAVIIITSSAIALLRKKKSAQK